jgi:hypothetical protein
VAAGRTQSTGSLLSSSRGDHLIIEVTMERREIRTHLGHGDWESEDIALVVYRPIYGHVRGPGTNGLMTLIPQWGPPKEVRC